MDDTSWQRNEFARQCFAGALTSASGDVQATSLEEHHRKWRHLSPTTNSY